MTTKRPKKSPFTKTQIDQAMQAAKAEGFGRVELTSPDGHRVVFEVTARETQPEPGVVEELE